MNLGGLYNMNLKYQEKKKNKMNILLKIPIIKTKK